MAIRTNFANKKSAYARFYPDKTSKTVSYSNARWMSELFIIWLSWLSDIILDCLLILQDCEIETQRVSDIFQLS